jgi:hypothetical protein
VAVVEFKTTKPLVLAVLAAVVTEQITTRLALLAQPTQAVAVVAAGTF